MKYIPAGVLLVIAALCLLFALIGGDNSDNKALALLFVIPAGLFALAGVIATAAAWLP